MVLYWVAYLRRATTHADLLVRAAMEKGVKTECIHNASIMTSVAACGLQLYNFGQTVSIPFFEDNWRPDSFYDKIKVNKERGFHTLCLLDIKVKERSIESLMKGLDVFEEPRFMSINCALDQLLEIEERRQEGVLSGETRCVGVARMGRQSQQIVYGTIDELRSVNFGPPLHSVAIVGSTHFMEDELLDSFHVSKQEEGSSVVDDDHWEL